MICILSLGIADKMDFVKSTPQLCNAWTAEDSRELHKKRKTEIFKLGIFFEEEEKQRQFSVQ